MKFCFDGLIMATINSSVTYHINKAVNFTMDKTSGNRVDDEILLDKV